MSLFRPATIFLLHIQINLCSPDSCCQNKWLLYSGANSPFPSFDAATAVKLSPRFVLSFVGNCCEEGLSRQLRPGPSVIRSIFRHPRYFFFGEIAFFPRSLSCPQRHCQRGARLFLNRSRPLGAPGGFVCCVGGAAFEIAPDSGTEIFRLCFVALVCRVGVLLNRFHIPTQKYPDPVPSAPFPVLSSSESFPSLKQKIQSPSPLYTGRFHAKPAGTGAASSLHGAEYLNSVLVNLPCLLWRGNPLAQHPDG